MSDSTLTVERVSLRIGTFALQDISFSLAPGQVYGILGPSGAGKSVLLETIAGFYWPDHGRILIEGRDVTRAAPEARRVGFMFQDYALFPHLTVAQNVKFGLQFRRSRPRPTEHSQVQDLLARLGLEQIAERHPSNLSGGEKQRVALARALAMEPAFFLFDEPLSALDARTRDSLREELRTLLRELGVPAIYVTHDQTEALVLADRLAVIRDGVLLQEGTPSEVFGAPVDEFVARFVGVETIIAGRVLCTHDGVATVQVTPERRIEAVDHGAARSPSVLVCIRPEDVALNRPPAKDSAGANQFPGRVVGGEPLGPMLKVKLDCGFPLTAFVTKRTYLDLKLAPGAEVVAHIEAAAVHLIGQP